VPGLVAVLGLLPWRVGACALVGGALIGFFALGGGGGALPTQGVRRNT
jgi:hypothetical protein